MTPFSVEIFDRSLELKHHTNADLATYSIDYLIPKASSISIPYTPDVAKGDYIRIYRDGQDFFGVVKVVTDAKLTHTVTQIEYEPFLSAFFSNEVLFDTTAQGGALSLEQEIYTLIRANWMVNADTLQNIPGLQLETISETQDWNFYITPSSKLSYLAIVNLYDQILVPALAKYKVGLYVVPDFTAKTITIRIGVVSSTPYYIEADLPSVISKNISLGETSVDVNKLIVYNNDDVSVSRTFYKHPDRSYDDQDRDRITPVIYSIATVTPSDQEPWDTAAQLAADRQFDQASYSNLIELTVLNSDPLVKPGELEIGQEVYIISGGQIYTSMLTGKTVGLTTTLIFGSIRLDLTQLIKERF